jgi:hypothetical protein
MAGQKESPGHCALPPGGHVGPGGVISLSTNVYKSTGLR